MRASISISVLGVLALSAAAALADEEPEPARGPAPGAAVPAPRPDDDREARLKKARALVAALPEADLDVVRELAVSRYLPEVADALASVAAERRVAEAVRSYAAMGLGNFSAAMAAGHRETLCARMEAVVRAEKAAVPDGIVRLLIQWGRASSVHDMLGDALTGHPLEVAVLEALPAGPGPTERLYQLLLASPRSRKEVDYNRRWAIGAALVNRRDKRGVDALIALLPADAAPSGQHRSNLFRFLATKLRERFGYEAANYDPSLEPAVVEMAGWWERNRDAFEFERKGPGRQ